MERRSEPQKIHIGDILFNGYASERNPGRISVIIGQNAGCVFTAYPYNGISRSQYAKDDVRYNPKFEIIGHIDLEVNIEKLIELGKW